MYKIQQLIQITVWKTFWLLDLGYDEFQNFFVVNSTHSVYEMLAKKQSHLFVMIDLVLILNKYKNISVFFYIRFWASSTKACYTSIY